MIGKKLSKCSSCMRSGLSQEKEGEGGGSCTDVACPLQLKLGVFTDISAGALENAMLPPFTDLEIDPLGPSITYSRQGWSPDMNSGL